MVKLIVQKYFPSIPLITSSIFLLATLALLALASRLLITNPLFIFLFFVLFLQFLIIPYFLFKIVKLETVINLSGEKIKAFEFCNSFFSNYKNILSECTGELHSPTILFCEMADLQNNILKPNKKTVNINEAILASIKRSSKSIIHFQVNPSLRLVELNEKYFLNSLITIIEVALNNTPEGAILEINPSYKKPLLKIEFEINRPLFIEQNFALLLAEHSNKRIAKTYIDARDFSLFDGYLIVNNGKIFLDDPKKKNSSIASLTFKVERPTSPKD